MSKHVKVEQSHDGTWTVYTTPGVNAWCIGADFPDEASARRVADAINREAVAFAGAPRTDPAPPPAPAPMTLDGLREHIAAVVAYNWQAEMRDACEQGTEGHIINHLIVLATFIGDPPARGRAGRPGPR